MEQTIETPRASIFFEMYESMKVRHHHETSQVVEYIDMAAYLFTELSEYERQILETMGIDISNALGVIGNLEQHYPKDEISYEHDGFRIYKFDHALSCLVHAVRNVLHHSSISPVRRQEPIFLASVGLLKRVLEGKLWNV